MGGFAGQRLKLRWGVSRAGAGELVGETAECALELPGCTPPLIPAPLWDPTARTGVASIAAVLVLPLAGSHACECNGRKVAGRLS